MTDIEIEIAKLSDRIDILENERLAKDGTIKGMTLAELEAMAERLGAAAKTIRDAQSLLGNHVGTQLPTAPAPVIQRGAPNPMLTAAENAERARLIRQNTMGPDDLEAMERT